ncbi:putative beta-phosphoglucomutase YvdM [Peptoclostridium acidaminophilum DSM 3953]|uniref:Beta-phosphoglucomutase n=1 Tax=Peptoclostridium acidaminophilum DSM 3953 TaxID=1286171 RepID=W8U944_PEPAC|nr:beta-phosphoglucomutase [Peptoclostridium acidaminophilum]AHM57376.1 putative beta-phosphoglucomutase YvdM [Peptoclostridium acidaminophilum DSM 3953]
MLRACIFDLDGVIVDTSRYHFLAWKRLMESLGSDLSEEENNCLRGVSRIESLRLLLRMKGMSVTKEQFESLIELKNTWYREYIAGLSEKDILEGALELLRELRNKGLKLGLASSSKNAREVIDRLGIGMYFDAIVDGSMISRAKPDPQIFLLCAGLLCESPSECAVFEDAASGIEAARSAGMVSVGVEAENSLERADMRVRSLLEADIDKLSECVNLR